LRHAWVRSLLLFPTAAAALHASGSPPQATRAEQIEVLRAAKAAHLKPEELPVLHRAFRYAQERRLFDFTATTRGIGLRFGGLGPGSGFAAGPEYIRPGLFGNLGVLRTSVVGSTSMYYSLELGFGMPRLAAGRFSLDFSTFRWSAPFIDYYGPGPDSFKTGRTDYAMENTAFETRATLHSGPHISYGGLTRYLFFNVGPGRNPRFAPTQDVYTPATTPGLLQQTNFFAPGVFLELDWRRFPHGRRNGSRFLAEYSTFVDTGVGTYSFGRVDLDYRRFFAFMHGQREIALRARTVFSAAIGPSGVPFYVQPQLGGAYDLRGFRGRRFYDNDLYVLNAEYRWEIADQIDAALFGDAGKVFPSLSRIQPFRSLEACYGFGLRFRRGSDVFWRVDLGFSREGPQLWLTFGDLF
jgi:hypothetical protein